MVTGDHAYGHRIVCHPVGNRPPYEGKIGGKPPP